jgi:diaminopimelate epimerase
MEFTKMHGLGNDFIVLVNQSDVPVNAAQLAIQMCDRNFGIGADGLVFILPSSEADVKMRIINSDGTEAEQCGNAVRCVAKFAYDNGIVAKEQLTVETLGAGIQQLYLTIDNSRVTAVRVDMGRPIFEGSQVPTTIDQRMIVNHPIEADGRRFHFTAVSLGNPHAVIFVEDAVNYDLYRWGPRLEVHPYFPRKTNVEFATVQSRDHIDMRVWERGAGPTLACGTGACATLVAAVLTGQTDRQATVSLKGGDLWMEWSEEDDRLYMTGPAETVYQGKWLG